MDRTRRQHSKKSKRRCKEENRSPFKKRERCSQMKVFIHFSETSSSVWIIHDRAMITLDQLWHWREKEKKRKSIVDIIVLDTSPTNFGITIWFMAPTLPPRLALMVPPLTLSLKPAVLEELHRRFRGLPIARRPPHCSPSSSVGANILAKTPTHAPSVVSRNPMTTVQRTGTVP